MDSLDHQLLSLLRRDARASTAELARKLQVSRGTVQNRISRLEDCGLILGYSVRLRTESAAEGITAWMSIAIEGPGTRHIVGLLLGEPAVVSLHDTNGRWDLLAEVRAASIAELSDVLERVRRFAGIANTETSIHLQSFRTR